ncbi:uncharacterized protein LOC134701018 [Mytilus trossulus]|uniref:uncharacterized protein LOC134701018 n=1 Tax=Mytilus trossulus TaxID=6551 RepID=UPI003005B0D3
MKTLVMNVSGNNHKPVGLDLKPGEKQRDVAVKIITSYKPDLILAQEGNKVFYEKVCRECKDGGTQYHYVYNEETGILFNVVDWTIEKPKADLEKMYDELVHKNIISRESELKARFHALILKSNGTDGNFLCVTYHGRYTGKTKDKKLDILKDFLKLLCNYLEDNPSLSLILGGDFNVELDDDILQDLISKGDPNYENDLLLWKLFEPSSHANRDLSLIPYAPTGNRANIYDHIIVSSTINVSEIQAVDVFKKIKELFQEVSKEHYPVILDHDPICVTFKIDTGRV